ncbi:PP2C family serine/threonine-protein phosphatase [Cellulomonas sp. PSBB021]|uniref:PP2C family protein-serine/threonine phosphatase n=1 Tax=Cellulomonas sp. PSBB021 TaxID=2003551 RepID=UPI000B8D66C9|nr:PP2C family serine/threonine-protein phosphatase [Cellulomonas sp. PSBB021]ASR55969.1 serine/threonine protein phosphatase [Cellulomonas sp. PSBB021]
MTVALRYAARSDVGLVRSNNQDSAYAGPHLLMVADGMGGHAGGDVASSVAVATFAPLDDESHGPDDALDELESALDEAREEIKARSGAEPELAGMGTTVTAILRAGNKLAMVHLGDSRGYLLRDGVLTQVTTDHTFVQHLVDIGRITPQEAEHHPQRSVVMRVLGDFDTDLTPDLSVREARAGDRWLLCSDGLSGFVSAETIETTMRELGDIDSCADRLVQLALRGGGGDNVTVVIADVVELDDLPDGAAPGTAPQVVGAAATTRDDPTVAADGPAARAAGLAQAAARAQKAGLAGARPADDDAPDGSGPDGDPDDDADLGDAADDARPAAEDDDEDGDEPARSRRTRTLVAGAGVLAVVVALVAGGYAWTRTQWFVGVDGDEVAIFRGVPESLGPVTLSTVVERTGIAVDDIASQYVRERVVQTIHADDRASAGTLVDEIVLLEDADDEPDPGTTAEPSPTRTPDPTQPATDPTGEPTATSTRLATQAAGAGEQG